MWCLEDMFTQSAVLNCELWNDKFQKKYNNNNFKPIYKSISLQIYFSLQSNFSLKNKCLNKKMVLDHCSYDSFNIVELFVALYKR